jgi:hypothetical protein
MTAAPWNLTLEQGVTNTITLHFWADDAGTVPFSLADYDFTGSARQTVTSYDKWFDFDFTKTGTNGVIMNIDIPFDAEYITGLRFDTYVTGVWDVLMAKSGEIIRAFNGTLKISPGVTRNV